MVNILVIDDEKQIRDAIRNTLRIEGHNVIGAKNLNETKTNLKENVFDIIFLDLLLSQEDESLSDGLQILKYIKNEMLIETPVIIFTGHGNMDSAIEALRIGAHDYKIKPIYREDLINTVNNIIQQKQIEKEIILNEKLAEFGGMAASIAHDIRNPLTGIIGKLLNISEEKSIEKIQKYKNDALDDARRIQAIIRDLMYDVDLKMEPICINDTIERAIDKLRHVFDFHNIQLEKKGLKSESKILATKIGLEQIFINLIENSVQAVLKTHKKKGKIELKSYESNSNVIVKIEDDGIGIPKDKIEKIFFPQFSTRIYESKNKKSQIVKGMGIGLYLVNKNVKRFSGKIEVGSKENRGTVIKLIFPIKKEV